MCTFAKSIPGFKCLHHDDQVCLLKSCIFEVLLVRLSGLFDNQVRDSRLDYCETQSNCLFISTNSSCIGQGGGYQGVGAIIDFKLHLLLLLVSTRKYKLCLIQEKRRIKCQPRFYWALISAGWMRCSDAVTLTLQWNYFIEQQSRLWQAALESRRKKVMSMDELKEASSKHSSTSCSSCKFWYVYIVAPLMLLSCTDQLRSRSSAERWRLQLNFNLQIIWSSN